MKKKLKLPKGVYDLSQPALFLKWQGVAKQIDAFAVKHSKAIEGNQRDFPKPFGDGAKAAASGVRANENPHHWHDEYEFTSSYNQHFAAWHLGHRSVANTDGDLGYEPEPPEKYEPPSLTPEEAANLESARAAYSTCAANCDAAAAEYQVALANSASAEGLLAEANTAKNEASGDEKDEAVQQYETALSARNATLSARYAAAHHRHTLAGALLIAARQVVEIEHDLERDGYTFPGGTPAKAALAKAEEILVEAKSDDPVIVAKATQPPPTLCVAPAALDALADGEQPAAHRKKIPGDNALKITKVSYSKNSGVVKIEYNEFNETAKGWDSKTLISEEAPLPEFSAALNALTRAAMIAADLPDEWLTKLTITGVAIHEKDDARSYVVKAYRTLKANTKPLILNTPSFDFDALSEADGESAAAQIVGSITTATDEAKRYLLGERAQGTLPFGDDDAGDGDEESATHTDSNPYGHRTAKGKGYDAGANGSDGSDNPYAESEGFDAESADWESGRREGVAAAAPLFAGRENSATGEGCPEDTDIADFDESTEADDTNEEYGHTEMDTEFEQAPSL